MRLLGDAGLPFDACVCAHQLPELAELAAACPQTTIVLDHLGKAPAEAQCPGNTAWRQAMRRLARRDNIVCKVSGLATLYHSWLNLIRAAFTAHPPAAAGAVLGGNAVRIYRVSLATSAREPAREEDPA